MWVGDGLDIYISNCMTERGIYICVLVTEGERKMEGCDKSVSVTYKLKERCRDVCNCVDE